MSSTNISIQNDEIKTTDINMLQILEQHTIMLKFISDKLDKLEQQVNKLVEANPNIIIEETLEQQQEFITYISHNYPKEKQTAIFSRYHRDPKLAREIYIR